MKRKHAAALLCCLLLGMAGLAAGSREDPLISRDWVESVFLPRAGAALEEVADAALKSRPSAEVGAELRNFRAGETLALETGQQFQLLSGAGTLQTERGEVVDASAGTPAKDGPMQRYARYIVCEDSAAALTLTESSLLRLSSGTETEDATRPEETPAPTEDGETEPELPFADVPPESWFYSDVAQAYRRGLVSGMTADSYVPGGTLTAAQCVKLAACMRQLRRDGAVTLENSAEGPWYGSYVRYALDEGIMGAPFADYDAPVTRRAFLRLFYNALPEDEFAEINAVPDGSIPDLPEMDADAARAYRFYRAGILTGYTATPGYAERAFGPESTITRAEVAVIMNRMFDAAARVRFVME